MVSEWLVGLCFDYDIIYCGCTNPTAAQVHGSLKGVSAPGITLRVWLLNEKLQASVLISSDGVPRLTDFGNVGLQDNKSKPRTRKLPSPRWAVSVSVSRTDAQMTDLLYPGPGTTPTHDTVQFTCGRVCSGNGECHSTHH